MSVERPRTKLFGFIPGPCGNLFPLLQEKSWQGKLAKSELTGDLVTALALYSMSMLEPFHTLPGTPCSFTAAYPVYHFFAPSHAYQRIS